MIVPLVKCAKIDPFPKYTYSGTAPRFKHDDSGNWEICFTGDCQITFQRVLSTIDVFVVAGGLKGKYGEYGSGTDTAVGGKGGNGGGIANASAVRIWPNEMYKVHVGKAGEDSNAFGVQAFAGSGYEGGVGAKVSGSSVTRTAAIGSDAGESYDDCAFGTNETLFWPGYKYGSGGGGGGAKVNDTSTDGARGGGGRTVDGVLLPAGGDGRGGNGEAGTTNSGGGGGGAGFVISSTNISYEGGKGGSGIVIIRNHR